MNLELKWFIYVLIQHEIVTPEFALTLLARLGQEDTELEEYTQQLFELLSAELPANQQSKILQQLQSFIEYAMTQSDTGEEPPEIYELEIVDDDFEEEEAVEEYTQETPVGESFNPFAGRGASPSGAIPFPPPPSPIVAARDFDDEFPDTVITDAPEEDDFNDTTTRNEISRIIRPTPSADAALNERVITGNPEISNEPSGPSVEDIMALFNRKHGGGKDAAVSSSIPKSVPRAPATETTRSLKKVKVEARVLSDSSKPATPGDTVPLSLPHFFNDTARRTMKVPNMPRLDSVESLNAGECVLLMMELVAALRRLHVSDIYVNANERVFVRRFGLITYLDTPVLSALAAERLNLAMVENDQKSEFAEKRKLSYSLVLRDGRCRCNLRDQMHGVSGSYHLAPSYVRPLNELGFLPEDELSIHKMLDCHSGLIVVAGPAGSGKTTTLAAMIDYICNSRACKVIMLENPIEIVQESEKGSVIQREINRHTSSMSLALQAATREDPDVVVMSEIYNPSTIEQALRATEDGLLVIVSMFATSTAAVFSRLMEVFEPMRRPEVRAMISGNLRGIVVQKLVDAAERDEQTVIYELMTNTAETAGMLVDGRIADVTELMRNGKQPNMCTFDNNVMAKYHAGHLTGSVAQKAVHHPEMRMNVELEVAIAESRKLLSDWKKQKQQ